jgi:hypothetical protein
MARIAGVISPTLGGVLFALALLNALSLWAAAFAIGGVVVFLLGVETKRQALSDTVSDAQAQQAETTRV